MRTPSRTTRSFLTSVNSTTLQPWSGTRGYTVVVATTDSHLLFVMMMLMALLPRNLDQADFRLAEIVYGCGSLQIRTTPRGGSDTTPEGKVTLRFMQLLLDHLHITGFSIFPGRDHDHWLVLKST